MSARTPEHWALLGIAPTRDTRAIKRAYASALRTHRPDEDIDAFQRLRQAYEHALAEAERGAAKVKVPPAPTGFRPVAPVRPTPLPQDESDHAPPDNSQHGEPLPPIPKAVEPLPPPQRPAARPDPERIAARLHAQLRQVPVAEIEVWLDQQDELLPLTLRDHISAALLERVICDRDFSGAHTLALCDRFNWDDVLQLQRLIALRPNHLKVSTVWQHFQLAQIDARLSDVNATTPPPCKRESHGREPSRRDKRIGRLRKVVMVIVAILLYGSIGAGMVTTLHEKGFSELLSGNTVASLSLATAVLMSIAIFGGNSRR